MMQNVSSSKLGKGSEANYIGKT